MRFLRKNYYLLTLLLGLLLVLPSHKVSAQNSNNVIVRLTDAAGEEPVAFATVSLTKKGAKSPLKFVLSNEEGKATLDKIPSGEYILKAELMGYQPYTVEINVKGNVDLGQIQMRLDSETLNAATVTDVGNPIVMKKDTVEYTASSFKTTDNDMLEDLLKKLPGVEVSEDGSVTANGQTISKILIDGKTFFLDDPQLATKNIPAKIINKVKVVDRKSEQARFTGIDDGEEEHIIDLSIQKGMMNGLFGNIMLGGGHDLPEDKDNAIADDFRYQGAGFIGRFTEKNQLSIILNSNNTNNRGFNDLAGSSMQGMRGGGGGMGRGGGGGFGGGRNGISTSWMGGVNGTSNFFEDKMEAGGNYLFNSNSRKVLEDSYRETYVSDTETLIYKQDGMSENNSSGHRFGARIEHKFSENTSFIFQPQVNFGKGDYNEISTFSTQRGLGGNFNPASEGFTYNDGDSRNWQTNGFLLFRQRLGKEGRTASVMLNYNFGGNRMDGYNQSLTTSYNTDRETGEERIDNEIVNQYVKQNRDNSSFSGRFSYTEPLGKGFFAEVNYSYRYNRNKSTKDTYDSGDGYLPYTVDDHRFIDQGRIRNEDYSSDILNRYTTNDFGADVVYQKKKLRAQAGFGVAPTHTHNETNGRVYNSNQTNKSPRVMFRYEIGENISTRLDYFGRSAQPSTSQLMPVPDNSNPLNVSFGNPYLTQYFNNNFRSEFRYTNRETFTSINLNLGGGFTVDPIVNATWYGTAGQQYSLPVNGPNNANANARLFINTPIAKSNFSIFSMTSGNYSKNYSYVGSTFDTEGYYDGTNFDYEAFHRDFPKLDDSEYFTLNKMENMTIMQRLRFTYRNDFVELVAGGSTRVAKSWYTITTASTSATWNNQVQGSMNWTIPGGVNLVADANYNWYNGYASKQDPETVINAQVSKLLFKNQATVTLKVYDLLDKAKNLTVSDTQNYHSETRNNTLGRYIILSLTYRFGTMGGNRGNRGPGGPGRGFGGPGGPGGPPRRF